MAGGPRFMDEDDEHGAAAAIAASAASTQPEASSPAPLGGPVLLEAELGAPERLHVTWDPGIILVPRPVPSTALWIIGGIGVLFASWLVLSLARFVFGLFQWSQGLGVLSLVAIVAGLGSIAYGAGLEWRAYRSLEATERLRAILAANDLPIGTVRAASLAWARKVAPNASADIEPIVAGLQAATTAAEIRAILRSKLLDRLRDAALRIGQQASIEVSAFVAICPHPALDGVVVTMRSLVMIRRIATLYAVRPGTAVTIALMRRVALMSATTSAIDALSVGFADHLLNNLPIIKHIAAAIPGASAAALRIYRLSGVTADTCCPIRIAS